MADVRNPPAFPLPLDTMIDCEGMTLRDWFAAQALPCVSDSYPEWQLRAWFGDRGGIKREEIRAKAAYALADAMLAERVQS